MSTRPHDPTRRAHGSPDWLCAALIGVCVPTVLATLYVRYFFYPITTKSAPVYLVIGAIAFLIALRKLPRRVTRAPMGWWDRLAVCAAGWFVWRGLGWVVFADPKRLMVLSPNNLGDMSLHITFIRYLAGGAAFWPESPILTLAPLRYPLGIDLFNALLLDSGMGVISGIVAVGLLGGIAVFAGLWRWSRGFGIAAFLFAGGLAGFAVFQGNGLEDYQDAMAWKSLPLASLVTQRGLLYALPVGLLLLDSWRSRMRGGGRKPLPAGVEILLLGTLPLFHAHSFMCLVAVLGGVAAFGAHAVRRHVTVLLLSIIPPSVLLTHWVVGGLANGGEGFAFSPGWMQGEHNPLWFWFSNFGVFPIVLGALAVRMWTVPAAGRETPAFVLPALALVALASLFRLAPWEWDNVKVFMWAYLIVLPYAFTLVIRPLPMFARIPALVLLFFSGAVSLAGGLGPRHAGLELASRRELDACSCASRLLIPPGKVITAQAHNHPVLLNGWGVAAGYDGHLWSHGYQTRKGVEESLRIILSGSPEWKEAVRRIQTRYLCWSRLEQEAFPDSPRPWEERYPLVGSAGGFEFYDLNELLDPSVRGPRPATNPDQAIAKPTPSL